MELTKEALLKLKGLTAISNEIVIESKTLGFVDVTESIICFYDWGVDIEESFGIIDINNFLTILNIYKDPIFDFKKDSIIIKEDKNLS